MVRRPCPALATLAGLALVACAGSRPPANAPRDATKVLPDAGAPSLATAPPAPPGIRLPDAFRPAAERVELEVVPTSERFVGRVEIDGTLSTAGDVVWLNADGLTVSAVAARLAGEEVAGTALPSEGGRIALRFPRPLPAGPLTLTLAFGGPIYDREDSGIFRQKSGGDFYVFTQFEEFDARRGFPCVDEPSAKIPWTVTLHVPVGHLAVSNTPAQSQTPESNGMKAVRFQTTRPLPAYLVAFGVGPFDVLEGRRAGRKHVPVRVITPRGRASEGAWAARITPEILEGLEDYFGMAYPYEKLDLLAIPVTVGFGAMENAGLVTYREGSLLARPEEDSVRRRRSYADVAAHELAHQWFGDLVTTSWWNDVWLNEAFATWMEMKVVDRWAPAWHVPGSRVETRDKAARADTLLSARRIRQPIESYDDVKNAFDGITYSKGASVLRMFETWVGEEAFRRGVQRYLQTHADGNATSSDFLRAISGAAGRDVAPAFESFLDRPGVPRIRASLRCGGGGPAVLHLQQDRWLPAGSPGDRAQTWQVPVCSRWSTRGQKRASCTLMTGPEQDVVLERGGACPEWVLPNAGYAGYYRLQLEGDLRERLVRSRALDDAETVGLLGDATALADGGAIPRADVLALAARFARTREPHVALAAREAALVREDVLGARLAPAYAAWVRRTFGPSARALGFSGPPTEDDDARLVRPGLAEFVALRGADPVLTAQARAVVERWLARPTAADPETLGAALRTAGRAGGADLHAALLEHLGRAKDIRTREWLLEGLAATREPALLARNVEVAASGTLDGREIQDLLTGARYGWSGPVEVASTRAVVLREVDARWDALVALLPRGAATRLFRLAASGCSAEERATAERVLGPRAPAVLGGPRAWAQALERLDQCIAQREREQPGLERFLAGPAPRRPAQGG